MYTSPHGTQNIKNLSNLFFFFFSSASFIVTPFFINPPLRCLFQFEGWMIIAYCGLLCLGIHAILVFAGVSLPLDILEASL